MTVARTQGRGHAHDHRRAAFFDLLDVDIAEALDCSMEELAERRQGLEFLPSPSRGWGSAWPRVVPGDDDHAGPANRRVDIWLFGRDELPEVDDPAELYGPERRFDAAPLDPRSDAAGVAVAVHLVDRDGYPVESARLRAVLDGREIATPLSDRAGHVPLRTPRLPVEITVDDWDLLTIYGPADPATDPTAHSSANEQRNDPLGAVGAIESVVDGLADRLVLTGPGPIKVMLVEQADSGDPVLPNRPDEPEPSVEPIDPDDEGEEPYRIDELSRTWRHRSTHKHTALTPDEWTLKQATYRAHSVWAAATSGRPMCRAVPANELAKIPGAGLKLRQEAAAAAGDLLAAAVAAARAHDVRVQLISAYRDADEQLTPPPPRREPWVMVRRRGLVAPSNFPRGGAAHRPGLRIRAGDAPAGIDRHHGLCGRRARPG